MPNNLHILELIIKNIVHPSTMLGLLLTSIWLSSTMMPFYMQDHFVHSFYICKISFCALNRYNVAVKCATITPGKSLQLLFPVFNHISEC